MGLCRGKCKDNGEWVEGYYCCELYSNTHYIMVWCYGSYAELQSFEVVPETVGRYTSKTDKNGKKIFEGDIVQYLTDDDFDCQSVVRFGEYIQDGSGGEYRGTKCMGLYIEVDNFTCPDWCDNEPEYFRDYMRQQNILEVASKCEIIGNIYDNPELLDNTKEVKT